MKKAPIFPKIFSQNFQRIIKFSNTMKLYFVISKFSFTQHDLNNLLYFYLPVIKFNCFALFQYFLSIKNIEEAVNHEFLERIFGISLEDFDKSRWILESLNLIETFYDPKQKKYFINLKIPLNPSQIDKNPYIKQLVSQKITAKTYSSLILRFNSNIKKNNNPQIDTLNFYNLSKKFYEVFDVNNQKTTNLLAIDKNFDNKKAKEELNFENYHLYLTKKLIRPRVRNSLESYQKEKNFSNYAINSVIEYSYKVNSQIVFNYMKKILDDLWENKIIKGEDVDIELEEIFKLKQKNKKKLPNTKIKTDFASKKETVPMQTNNKDLSSDSKNNSDEIDWIVNELNSGDGWI